MTKLNDTITANNYYRVIYDKTKSKASICDGNIFLFIGEVMTYNEFLDEYLENEAFHMVEVFTTRKQNQFIYARDEETDQDFIIKLH